MSTGQTADGRHLRGGASINVSGEMLDDSTGVPDPGSEHDLAARLLFGYSHENVDRKLKAAIGNLGKITQDLEPWCTLAAEGRPNGLPGPFSNDLAPWLFDGHPAGAGMLFHVTVPRRTGPGFPDRRAPGPDGSEELADSDRIVSIPAARGERPAHERVLQALRAAWGDSVLARLPGDAWLRSGFLEQHCRLFHRRPSIWHTWDGRKGDGPHALVSCHKLTETGGGSPRLPESLTCSCLRDWIGRRHNGAKDGEFDAGDRLAATLELHVLKGEPPFEPFVRRKPLEDHPTGRDPGINGGVRLNVRPFMARNIPGARKGAGISRLKPTVHWKKGRGRESVREQSRFPWFWRSGTFMGERPNDLRCAVAERKAARDRARDWK